MSHWQRFHLEETIKAMATPDNHRFFIQVREPPVSIVSRSSFTAGL
jgi:hypothetical protein